MKRFQPGLEPELEALLTPRRIERLAPPDVRARALARGRAIVAAGGVIPARVSLALLTLAPAKPMWAAAKPVRGRSLARSLLPASLGVAAVAMGALTVQRSPPASVPALAPIGTSISGPIKARSVAVLEHGEEAAPASAADPPLIAPQPEQSPARSQRERDTAELQLLARAQAAYSRRDFRRAVALIGELTRRFPNGHLAEEREALRVRSLFGLGTADQGGRAATAFARRFPRSVLLPNEGKP